jgi:hypothetical protein
MFPNFVEIRRFRVKTGLKLCSVFLILVCLLSCQSAEAQKNKNATERASRRLNSSTKGKRTTTTTSPPATASASTTTSAPSFTVEDFSRYVDDAVDRETVVLDISEVTSSTIDAASRNREPRTSKTVEREAGSYSYYNKLPVPGEWHPVQPVIVPHQPHPPQLHPPPFVIHPPTTTTTTPPSNVFHYTINYEVRYSS